VKYRRLLRGDDRGTDSSARWRDNLIVGAVLVGLTGGCPESTTGDTTTRNASAGNLR
jgi:hypothetical protein